MLVDDVDRRFRSLTRYGSGARCACTSHS
jgi:hypothetical protein